MSETQTASPAEPRVALVTGADSGIGTAIARRLAADGFAIAFATRSDGSDSAEAFAPFAERGTWLRGDLADPGTPARLAAEAERELGRIDVLVNNAGLTLARPALELTAEDLDRVFAVDTRAAFLLAQACARAMAGTGGGSIVNVTSVHAFEPRPGFAAYAAAKAALSMLTRSLALELGPLGIRVNEVAPGVIATERNTEAGDLGGEVVLGRAGQPPEVAAAVAFLVGEGSYLTGSTVLVDGGMSLQTVERPAGDS